MKIAYLILAHQHIDQLARLINVLADENVSLFMHVDAECSYDEDAFEQAIADNVNLFVLEPRKSLEWAGFSLVETTLRLLECCVLTGEYDYINLVSGQDFPIKSNSYITRFFQSNHGKEFIEYFSLPNEPRWSGYFGTARYEKFWQIDQLGFEYCKGFVDQQFIEGVKRTLPNSLMPYGGSQWFSISSACAKYIISYVRDNPQIIHFFRYTLASDEMFFISIIMNSPFKNNVVNNNLREIDWKNGPEYPRVLVSEDFLRLKNSDCLFARKFNTSTDCRILTQLEESLRSPTKI